MLEESVFGLGGEEQLKNRWKLLDERWLKSYRKAVELGRKGGVSPNECSLILVKKSNLS